MLRRWHFVAGTTEPLVKHRRYVVAGGFEQPLPAPANVLVEFELHAACGTGMMRSRVASAP